VANFSAISLACNRNTLGSPNWLAIGGANTEVRFSSTSTGLLTTGSASWPLDTRPGSGTAAVAYTYMFDADATGTGFISSSTGTGAGGANPPAFANSNYLWARWDWDNVGTFASAPIFTAYDNTSDNSPSSRGGGGLLAGHTSDTGATARSYLKANAFGRVVSGGAPAAAPSNAPTVTDGTTGSVSPAAGANWLTNYQGLMADIDYITFPSTPAATTADQWNVIFALFTGANMTPATYTSQLALKYTWT
jgi:hypothetical protein